MGILQYILSCHGTKLKIYLHAYMILYANNTQSLENKIEVLQSN